MWEFAKKSSINDPKYSDEFVPLIMEQRLWDILSVYFMLMDKLGTELGGSHRLLWQSTMSSAMCTA